MAEIGADFRGGYYGEQVEPSGGGWDPNSQKSGPLAKLYGSNIYDFNSRFYPRNLGSETRGHYINFYINVNQGSIYKENGRYTLVTTKDGRTINGKTAYNQAKGNTVTAVNLKNIANKGLSAGADVLGVEAPQLTNDISLGRHTKRITQAIALYMPDTMNVQYNASWDSSSLTDAGGKLLLMGQVGKGLYDNADTGSLGKTLKNVASDKSTYGLVLEQLSDKGTSAGLLGNDASAFLLHATGQALNPQLEVLFKGVDMRTFQFDFLFAPFDEDEAKNVLEIIKTFKFHMAPEINKGLMGRYFTPPSEFDIDFLFDGQINKNVHQVGTCVLQNVNVDYAPNGWSTFTNGMPTHIRMTLQFMETEIVTKQRVDEGY
jgi:hypothetical protein